MELENTPFVQEVEKILGDKTPPKFNIWSAEITANEKTVTPIQLNSIDFIRNYAGSYTDEIHLSLLLGMGTVIHDVIPYKQDLVVTLKRSPVKSDGEDEFEGVPSDLTSYQDTAGIDTYAQDITSQSFRAFVIDDIASEVEGNTPVDADKDQADLQSLRVLRLQLLDFASEQLRMKSVGGLFRNQTPGQVLKHALTSASQEIEVDAPYSVQGVHEVEFDNKTERDHIVIPHGTALTDLADYLQYRGGGLYNAGVGMYLQYRHWYVFPLYNHQRFDKELRTLTLINVPKTRLRGVERTYRTTAYQVIALVTGETKYFDDSEKAQLNGGNGLRYASAEQVVGGFAKVENNKAVVERDKNNSEFKTTERKTGLNNVQMSPRGITDNPFVELSKMTRRSGSHLQVVWENSDPGLIIPGMPVKYSYIVQDEVKTLYGTVIAAHHFVQQATPGFGNQRHITNSTLTLFVNRVDSPIET